MASWDVTKSAHFEAYIHCFTYLDAMGINHFGLLSEPSPFVSPFFPNPKFNLIFFPASLTAVPIPANLSFAVGSSVLFARGVPGLPPDIKFASPPSSSSSSCRSRFLAILAAISPRSESPAGAGLLLNLNLSRGVEVELVELELELATSLAGIGDGSRVPREPGLTEPLRSGGSFSGRSVSESDSSL